MASVKLITVTVNLRNALLVATLLTACGSGSGTKSILGNDAAPNASVAIAILNAAPVSACTNGGITIESGNDTNTNQVLESSEATNTQYVCNGTNGINGLATLLTVTNEPIGNHCSTGGNLVSSGIDSNQTGILENSEATSFSYICNGSVGTNGASGTNGFSTLSLTVIETAGEYCSQAGLKTMTGLDINTNASLDSNEVVSTNFVCNGTNGVDGLSTLVAVITEPIGEHCTYGGSRTTSGLDANVNAILEPIEVTSTSFVCNGFNGTNGTNGLSSLTLSVTEPPSLNCLSGGTKQTSGIDADANGTLNLSEVASTTYVCNGSNGSSGLNSLTALGVEDAGIHCANGGSKATSGVDINANQVLDSTEVTTTTYVCNGSNGLNTLVQTDAEAYGIHCATGGTRTTSGLDINTNSILDALEVTSTTYICNGANGVNGLNSLNITIAEPFGVNCSYGGARATSGLDNNANNILDSTEITSTTFICAGTPGPIGATGATGESGSGLSAYAYLYNSSAQTVAVQSPVLFNNDGVLFGVTHTAGAAAFQVLSTGAYNVTFSISSTEPNQFALFVNGVVAPGAIYGSGAGTQQNNGQITLILNAGDSLTLVNYSSAAAVTLASFVGGTQANVNASVSLQKLN